MKPIKKHEILEIENKENKLHELVKTSSNVSKYNYTDFNELYILFIDGYETVLDLDDFTAWNHETIDDIIKRLENDQSLTVKDIAACEPGDTLYYEITTLQGTKKQIHDLILENNGKRLYLLNLKDNHKYCLSYNYIINKLENVSILENNGKEKTFKNIKDKETFIVLTKDGYILKIEDIYSKDFENANVEYQTSDVIILDIKKY